MEEIQFLVRLTEFMRQSYELFNLYISHNPLWSCQMYINSSVKMLEPMQRILNPGKERHILGEKVFHY